MAAIYSFTLVAFVCAALTAFYSVEAAKSLEYQDKKVPEAAPELSPKGFYSSDGSFPARPCEKMTYQPFKGKTFCYPCPHGRISDHVGSSRCVHPPQKVHETGILGQSAPGHEPEEEEEVQGNSSSHPMPLTTINLTDAFGDFSTPGFPLPYDIDSEVKWHIQCSQSSYALFLLFDIDLRIGDKLVTDDKVIVGKWPFLYAYRIKHKGDTYMHLALNSSDTESQSKGVHGAYVCIDEDWYLKMPSLPSMVFENQYSLKKLKANPSLLHGYLDVFQSYYNLWNVFMIPNLEQHLSNIVKNVYRGGPPRGFPF